MVGGCERTQNGYKDPFCNFEGRGVTSPIREVMTFVTFTSVPAVSSNSNW